MNRNSVSLASAIEHWSIWQSESISPLSMSDGDVILLFYDINDRDENETDEQVKCIKYIESISKPSKIFFVTTARCAANILPLIHHYRQIDSIFILSTEVNEHLDFEDVYFKIIGTYNDEQQLIDVIQEQLLLEQQQQLTFSFYNQHQKSTRDLSKESASFLWLLLFKDVLVRIASDKDDSGQSKQDLIEQLKQRYRNNRTQLKLIEQFNKTYKSTDNAPIRWYTGKPFLHKQINCALRTEDIQMLHTFRYIISDISRCLKQEFEYIKDCVDRITLYRGLRITNEELTKLKENVDKIISTNGFLSTSRSRAVALIFAGKATNDKQSILFEIECDLNELANDSIIFADIARLSNIQSEEEVLFDIGAAFFLESVCYDNELNVWVVKLRATDEAARIAQVYLERNEEFIGHTSVKLTFGALLHLMGQFQPALDYFQHLLENSDEDIALLQFSIGIAQFELGNYAEAFACLETSRTMLELRQPPVFAPEAYAHIGYILNRMGQQRRALQVHLSCLEYVEKRTKYNPRYVAVWLGRVGNDYVDLSEYDQAMSYYMKSSSLIATCYPPDHVECGRNLGNIGSIHYLRGHIDKALPYYEQALSIVEKCLMLDHTHVIALLNNLGNIRRDQGDYSAALEYFSRCLTIEMRLFPEGHLDVASTINQIGHILFYQENYEQCLENYFKALKLQTDLVDVNHLECAVTLYDIGFAYAKYGKLDQALLYARQSLGLLDRNDSTLTTAAGGKCLLLLGSILDLQSKSDEALEYGLKSLKVLRDVHSQQEHPEVALCLTQLGQMYESMKMFDLALGSHREALSIRRNFLPADVVVDRNFSSSRHKDVADSLTNIANIYLLMGENELALDVLQQALTMKQIYYQPCDYAKLIMEMKCVAQALSCQGRWDHALNCYQQIDRLTTDEEEKILNLSNIGQCYRAKKDFATALDYHRRALGMVHEIRSSQMNTSFVLLQIKQDVDEMIQECVIRVFSEHYHQFTA